MILKMCRTRLCTLVVSCICILNILGAILASVIVNSFPKRWKECLTGTDSLVLQNVALQRCILECSGRNNCAALNYWPVRKECEIFKPERILTIRSRRKMCVYTERHELPVSQNCSHCSDHSVCNTTSGNCIITECETPPEIANGSIRGNVHTIGAKAKVICNKGFMSVMPNTTMTCLADGLWSQKHECIDPCFDGWVFIGTSCYKVIHRQTWGPAKETCKTMGGHLAYIGHSESHLLLTDFNLLNHIVPGFIWLGGRLSNKKEIYWTNGERVTFTNWDVNQPSNGPSEQCLGFSFPGILWHDLWCQYNLPGLCEIEIDHFRSAAMELVTTTDIAREFSSNSP